MRLMRGTLPQTEVRWGPNLSGTSRDSRARARRRLGGAFGLELLRASRLPELLDLGFGHVLVLGANHSKDGRSRVLATGNRAKLLGRLAPNPQRRPGGELE